MHRLHPAGHYLPRPVCWLSLISPGIESSETCCHDHGRASRKDRTPASLRRPCFYFERTVRKVTRNAKKEFDFFRRQLANFVNLQLW